MKTFVQASLTIISQCPIEVKIVLTSTAYKITFVEQFKAVKLFFSRWLDSFISLHLLEENLQLFPQQLFNNFGF